MSEKQKINNIFNDAKFRRQEPMKQKDHPVQKGDLDLDEELEEEIDDIDELKKEECVSEPDKCSVCDLQAQVDELKKTIEESREKLIRAHAEMENVRARSERKVEEAHRFALEKFVKELLPVVDNLERALETSSREDSVKALVDGVDLTLKMLSKVLESFGVKQLDPLNEPFNPAFHEAMSMLPNSDVEPNTVLTVFQKGYLLNGRLVRPARVIVSK